MRSLAITVCLLAGASLHAADKAAIAAAVKRGGEFLRTEHGKGGEYRPGVHQLGEAALAGLGMLEAGVPVDDRAMLNVTKFVRNGALATSGTYHIALAIIFLDRLGEKNDIPLIQMLGVRLHAGMNAAGGWTYECWPNAANADAILQSLQNNTLSTEKDSPKKEKKDDGFMKADAPLKTNALHPEVAKVNAIIMETIKSQGRPAPNIDDNSNTQFGIVGLWVAARHGVPAREAFKLIAARFIRTQNPADGGWSYITQDRGTSTMAMTCAGLLGLAVGKAAGDATLSGQKEKTDKPKGGDADDPFFNPKKGDGEAAEPAVKGKPAGTAAFGKSAEFALKSLAQVLAAMQQNGVQNNGKGLGQFVGAGNGLYTLWSLERACVGYSLETLGGVDWHDLGANMILPLQAADGSFTDREYGPTINTSLAILFLTKANFTRDLSAKNKGKDPFKVELRAGAGGPTAPLFVAPAKENKNKGQTEETKVAPGGFTLPTIAQPTEETEAEKVALALVSATDAEWPGKLEEAMKSRGAKWTRALVLASARLDGDRRYQTRDALAERLTRMKTKSLREMLKDNEAELRRAACLACAMKEDTEHIPDLIERLTDANEFVIRAARAGLRSFAPPGTDFGPPNGADEDSKVKSATAWAAWNEKRQEKK